MTKPEYEQLLNEFIQEQSWAARAGSGDDQFYVDQVDEYFAGQRPLWVGATERFVKIGERRGFMAGFERCAKGNRFGKTAADLFEEWRKPQ